MGVFVPIPSLLVELFQKRLLLSCDTVPLTHAKIRDPVVMLENVGALMNDFAPVNA